MQLLQGRRVFRVDVDDDLAADRVGRTSRRLDDRDEDAQHQRGHQHGQHRRQARRRVAGERPEGLLQEKREPHQFGWPSAPIPSSPRSRTANSLVDSSYWYIPASWSRMIRPWFSSITRRRILSTISRSWVATTTVVPVRLIR